MQTALRSATSLTCQFRDFIKDTRFPCVGAKTAESLDQIVTLEAMDLRCPADDRSILSQLEDFVHDYQRQPTLYKSFALLFHGPNQLNEVEFEAALWQRLQALHDIDRWSHPWDPAVSMQADEVNFSFSLAGQAFYIVGMHPGSSRPARTLPFPALIFNLHAQFEELRSSKDYGRMQKIVRRRDEQFNGSINPMLADFKKNSEAMQYSGRFVDAEWQCPFIPRPLASPTPPH